VEFLPDGGHAVACESGETFPSTAADDVLSLSQCAGRPATSSRCKSDAMTA
jgi:hypothetical protein